MTFVSVTRLRVRRLRFMPAFLLHTLRTLRQVRRAPGLIAGSLLGDRRRAFWTMTAWQDEAAMRTYMTAGAHRVAMPKLFGWCDEASVAHWTQDAVTLPRWEEAAARMRAEGRPSRVRCPSADHAALAFAPPRLSGAAPIRPVRKRGAIRSDA